MGEKMDGGWMNRRLEGRRDFLDLWTPHTVLTMNTRSWTRQTNPSGGTAGQGLQGVGLGTKQFGALVLPPTPGQFLTGVGVDFSVFID